MPIYLAPWVQSSVRAVPPEMLFRPRASDGLGNWSCMDLRGPSRVTQLVGHSLLSTDEPITDAIVRVRKIADSHTERLSAAAKIILERDLSLTLAAAVGTSVGDAIAELLLEPVKGGLADGVRWKPVKEGWRKSRPGGVLTRSNTERAIQVWLGGDLLHEREVRAASHQTVIIEADFSTASGTLNATAPEVTNTPGNNWVSTAGQNFQYNGSGKAQAFDSNNARNARINTGITGGATDDMSVECVMNMGGADNRVLCHARGDNNDMGSITSYSFRAIAGAPGNLQVFRDAAGSATTIEETTPTISNSADITWLLTVEGNDVSLAQAGTPTAGSPIDDSASGHDTGSYAGMEIVLNQANEATWDDFIVDNLAVAGGRIMSSLANAGGLAGAGGIAGQGGGLAA